MARSTDKDRYTGEDGKHLRSGFTTGSCAAAAAAAAAQMLLTGEAVPEVEIRTPGGPIYRAQILDAEICREELSGVPVSCRCAVRKDGGDDPDVTTGALIAAEVTRSTSPGIRIEGGTGVGRVTKPGLDQPVGEAAINRVPRQMIGENVGRVLRESTIPLKAPGLRVVISVPDGERLAARTFNPRLGITGGISILGTTGIVEPMSSRAVVETIRAQMSVRRAEGRSCVLAAPGNYGITFLTEKYGIPEEQPVLISNFVEDAVRIAGETGFGGILLAGHIGKLIKVAGGARNTHSMYGDRRMETLWEIAGGLCREHDRAALKSELEACVMTDAALVVLEKYGVKEATAKETARRICANLREWSGGRLRAETVVFSNRDRELVRSAGAEKMLRSYMGKKERQVEP